MENANVRGGNPVAPYETIVREEASKFCRTNRHVEVDDAEQEARTEVFTAIAFIECAVRPHAMARVLARRRLYRAFISAGGTKGCAPIFDDGLGRTVVVDRYGVIVGEAHRMRRSALGYAPDEISGAKGSYEAIADAFDEAMEADGTVAPGDAEKLSVAPPETRNEMRGIIAAILDPSLTDDARESRVRRWVPAIRKMYGIEEAA